VQSKKAELQRQRKFLSFFCFAVCTPEALRPFVSLMFNCREFQ